MARKREIIRLPVGNVDKMVTAYGVSRATVYNALNYSSNSEQAKLLRKKALEEYNGAMDKRTLFD